MYYSLGVFNANAFPPYLREYANPCAGKLALIIHFIKSIKKDIIEDKKRFANLLHNKKNFVKLA